jgi:hypothetical protein
VITDKAQGGLGLQIKHLQMLKFPKHKQRRFFIFNRKRSRYQQMQILEGLVQTRLRHHLEQTLGVVRSRGLRKGASERPIAPKGGHFFIEETVGDAVFVLIECSHPIELDHFLSSFFWIGSFGVRACMKDQLRNKKQLR